MVSYFLAMLALLSAVQSVPVAAAEDATGLSWTVYHSWNPSQQFVRRGSLTWGPPKSSSDDGEEGANNDEKKEFQIINDDASVNLTANDIRDMLEYGWYHVKIQSKDDDTNFVFQTVPACNLRRANFKDQFDVTLPRSSLGDRQDPMTSFAYTPLVSPLAPKNCEDYDDDDSDDGATKSFSSRVSVQLDTPAMTIKNILPESRPPPGIAFVKQTTQQTGTTGGSGQQRGGADDGENYEDPGANPIPPGPMGFFSKYWYILLPMVILQFLQAKEEPPPQQEGQQQQGQQQQQGGTNGGGGGGTIAPPAAAGSAPKARRGKTRKNN